MIVDMHTYLALEERVKSFAEDHFDLDHDTKSMLAYHDAKLLLHFAEDVVDRARIVTEVMTMWGV